MAPSTPSLLKLPLELHVEIVSYTVPRDHPIEWGESNGSVGMRALNPDFNPDTDTEWFINNCPRMAASMSCKALNDAARLAFWACNTFCAIHLMDVVRYLSPKTCEGIVSLALRLNSLAPPERQPCLPLLDLFPNLTAPVLGPEAFAHQRETRDEAIRKLPGNTLSKLRTLRCDHWYAIDDFDETGVTYTVHLLDYANDLREGHLNACPPEFWDMASLVSTRITNPLCSGTKRERRGIGSMMDMFVVLHCWRPAQP